MRHVCLGIGKGFCTCEFLSGLQLLQLWANGRGNLDQRLECLSVNPFLLPSFSSGRKNPRQQLLFLVPSAQELLLQHCCVPDGTSRPSFTLNQQRAGTGLCWEWTVAPGFRSPHLPRLPFQAATMPFESVGLGSAKPAHSPGGRPCQPPPTLTSPSPG